MPAEEESVSGAESDKSATGGEAAKKKKNKKKNRPSAPEADQSSLQTAEAALQTAEAAAVAVPAQEVAGAADGSVEKSASQIKREKQKAAAARRRAAATSASKPPCLDTHFATRYVDGVVGLEAERNRLSAAAEARTAKVTQLVLAGKDGQEISQVMRADEPQVHMPFDEVAATLLRLPSLDAEGAWAADAVCELLHLARGEIDDLEPGSNPKLLPRTLKWCAANLPALNALLAAAPEVRPDAPTGRLGLARLTLTMLFVALASAKRPPLTAALVACRPPPAAALASLLLSTNSSSTILGDAVLRLLRATLQDGTKPLRVAALSGAEPLQSIVVTALAPDVAALRVKEAPRLAPLRPFWIEVATVVAEAGGADKELKATLARQEGWVELEAALPALRARHTQGSLCGPPPVRPRGGVDGEMGEFLAMLERMQAGQPPS
jgi:hypothetical protein